MSMRNPSEVRLRPATHDDIPFLEGLIGKSAREVGNGCYSPSEIVVLTTSVFGVDSELVVDGTYFVAMIDGAVAGCGGWSRRATLFGGDRFERREAGMLDPSRDAAKIRAFFVDPGHIRRGVATAILDECERAAAAAGFRAGELMATLPGLPFYRARGYGEEEPILLEIAGERLRFVRMRKPYDAPVQ